jgi:hypothetical protein
MEQLPETININAEQTDFYSLSDEHDSYAVSNNAYDINYIKSTLNSKCFIQKINCYYYDSSNYYNNIPAYMVNSSLINYYYPITFEDNNYSKDYEYAHDSLLAIPYNINSIFSIKHTLIINNKKVKHIGKYILLKQFYKETIWSN